MNRLGLILLITVFLVFGCNDRKGSQVPGVLVTADWLQERLEDPSVVVLHTGTRERYDSLHIPGARFIDPYDFITVSGDLYTEIPETDTIIHYLRSAGVGMDSEIVLCYDEEAMISRTTRVFLALDYAGLGDRTRVLNGGLPGWLDEKRATTDEVPDFTTGDIEAGPSREVVITAAELDRERWNPDFVIVDVRSDDEYSGSLDSTGQNPSGGHIEGARSLGYELVFSDSVPYRFKEDEPLRELFGTVGLEKGKTSVYYCGVGARASVSYLAARHLGYDVKLYDGSFQQWGDLDMPVTAPVVEPADPSQ